MCPLNTTVAVLHRSGPLSLFAEGSDGDCDVVGFTACVEEELSALKARPAPVLGRREVQATGSAFVDGLLSGVGRKTGWLTAEQAGLARALSNAIAFGPQPVG